ncbi:MAG: carbohydrate kinase family protein [Candidatus Hodarchaeota archaeon]
MTETEELWPYVLFLPANYDRRRGFIRTVLASKVAPSVLSGFNKEGKALQRDLVRNLSHSNRSILAYLKTLKEFGLITTSSRIEEGKRVVVHELTKSGWGLARFFSEGLPSDLRDLTEYLLEDYLSSLVGLYREKGIESSAIFDIFARTRARAILQGSTIQDQPEFILFGASAFFTRIECTKLPSAGEEVGCNTPLRFPGGPTVDLSLALAKEGYRVALVSSIGNDQDGWNLISTLVKNNVDVSKFQIEDDKQTNQTIIIDEAGQERILVGISEISALSLTSPSQVPWEVLENAKVVYLGEVFLEIAISIAAYARAKQIPVVYRSSPHFWLRGLQEMEPVLGQVDVLLLSETEWREAEGVLGTNPIAKLQEITTATIIAKLDGNAYHIFSQNKAQPLRHISKHSVDGFTPWFVAGFLIELQKGVSTQDAFRTAISFELTRIR